MPYTLTMGLIWFLLALLVGVLVGWLLRSIVATWQLERARSAQGDPGDGTELERLRTRTAELEDAVAECEARRAELQATGPAGAADPLAAAATTTDPSAPAPTGGPADEPSSDAPTDIEAASAIIGRPVRLDDLTVVEGIGPKVAALCEGIGIGTWSELAATETSLLRTMLHDAGPRFRTHDPDTWPEQARLLAAGDWQGFVHLTESLDGGQR